MSDQIPTFLAVTGIDDEAVAKQYLDLTGGDLEYAVTLYMESQPPQTHQTNDEEYAQRLQQETYNNDEVRAADTNVHRHETLVDGFGGGGFIQDMMQQERASDIFGRARAGIFNQRFDDEENEYYQARSFEEEDDDDDDEMDYHQYEQEEEENNGDIIILDSDEEDQPRRPSRRRQARQSRNEELTSNQRRLLNLFRPPFDIMSKISIDSAKRQGRAEKKWILINIQDSTEFQCQVLNRDFWSNANVKQMVKDNFIFMQYQNDSPNGVNYLNFYSTNSFPHIAILDPLTGERVRRWKDGEVPQPTDWINDVHDFLSEFSLNGDSSNPVVQHEVKFDPDALTEEQQIEFAMKQSILENGGDSAENAVDLDSPKEESKPQAEKSSDPFDQITPKEHTEPTEGQVTRIQIRFPNGKRSIHKFAFTDTVRTIFEWLRYLLNESPDEYGLSGDEKFNLSDNSQKSLKLIESLDLTVEKANLKNASLLLEKE